MRKAVIMHKMYPPGSFFTIAGVCYIVVRYTMEMTNVVTLAYPSTGTGQLTLGTYSIDLVYSAIRHDKHA